MLHVVVVSPALSHLPWKTDLETKRRRSNGGLHGECTNANLIGIQLGDLTDSADEVLCAVRATITKDKVAVELVSSLDIILGTPLIVVVLLWP
jgi:hypothetical protein